MVDPITLIALLVLRSRMRRNDGLYELHYPAIRDRFVALVEQRIRLFQAIAVERPDA